MNKSHLVRTMCIVGVSAACVWGLSGCTGNNEASGNTAGTGGVAATVDGVEIAEDDVTNYIESLRANYNLADSDSWGQSLAQQGTNPAEFREDVIDAFVTRELIRAHAGERDVSVDSSEIDSYVQQTKSNYDDDEKWQTALDQAGMTEEDYRSEIELQLLDKYLKDSFASDEDPSEADQLQYAQMYASAYDGARRSSHILFASEDEATAQEVLDKINAGELDFVEAVKEYSKDTGSAENGGDVGWDKTGNLVTEYTDALAGLEKDQVSGLVTSTYGIHIIKCTDVYNAPKSTGEDGTEKVEITSVDQIPAEWLETLKTSLKSQAQSDAYSAWIEEKREAADIVINDMPDGLPYYVDVTKYETAESTDGATDGTDAGATEGADNAAAAEGADGNAEASDTADAGTDATSGQPAEAA